MRHGMYNIQATCDTRFSHYLHHSLFILHPRVFKRHTYKTVYSGCSREEKRKEKIRSEKKWILFIFQFHSYSRYQILFFFSSSLVTYGILLFTLLYLARVVCHFFSSSASSSQPHECDIINHITTRFIHLKREREKEFMYDSHFSCHFYHSVNIKCIQIWNLNHTFNACLS